LISCDSQKIDSYFQGPTNLSGNNAAIGGVNYDPGSQSGTKSWDQHISTCRLGNAKPGFTSIRFGSSSGNLPLTVARDDSGNLSFALAVPDGQVTGNSGADCTIKLTLNPSGDTAPSGQQAVDGEVKIACSQNGKDVNGAARFYHCGN
jgi:hypothetical protein